MSLSRSLKGQQVHSVDLYRTTQWATPLSSVRSCSTTAYSSVCLITLAAECVGRLPKRDMNHTMISSSSSMLPEYRLEAAISIPGERDLLERRSINLGNPVATAMRSDYAAPSCKRGACRGAGRPLVASLDTCNHHNTFPLVIKSQQSNGRYSTPTSESLRPLVGIRNSDALGSNYGYESRLSSSSPVQLR